MPKIDCWASSIQGKKNFNYTDGYINDAKNGIYVISDGKGTMTSKGSFGKITAELLHLDIYSNVLIRKNPMLNRVLLCAADSLNNKLKEMLDEDKMLKGSISVTTAMMLMNGNGKIIHIGDGRVYRFRGNSLKQLTRDHTVASELVQTNEISIKDISKHPLKNVLTQALGTNQKLNPEIVDVKYDAKDIFLLCTDGFSKALNDKTIQKILKANENLNAHGIGEKLIKEIADQKNQDDSTMIIVKV